MHAFRGYLRVPTYPVETPTSGTVNFNVEALRSELIAIEQKLAAIRQEQDALIAYRKQIYAALERANNERDAA